LHHNQEKDCKANLLMRALLKMRKASVFSGTRDRKNESENGEGNGRQVEPTV
jgi:hypothetical protein